MSLRNILYATALTTAMGCAGTQEKTYTPETEQTPQKPEVKPSLDTPEGRELLKGKYRVNLGEGFSAEYEVKRDGCILEYTMRKVVLTTIIDEGCNNIGDYAKTGIIIDGAYYQRGEGRITGSLSGAADILLKEAQKSVKPENKI